jgi:steroid Delta-isomerase
VVVGHSDHHFGATEGKVNTNMSTNDLQRLTSLYYRSIRISDVDGFVDLFATDGVSHDPVGAPPHVGHDGVRAFLTGVLGLCEPLDITPVETVFYQNSAALTWSAFALGKNGSRTEFGGIDVFTFDRDFRIATIHAFWDAAPVVNALAA